MKTDQYRRPLLLISCAVAVVFLFTSIDDGAFANPEAPISSGGGVPFVSATGSVLLNQTEVVYTVPADKVLILTGYCQYLGCIPLLADGVARITPPLASCLTSSSRKDTPFTIGSARSVFQPGTVLSLDYTSPTAEWCSTSNFGENTYFLQGYLADP